MIIFEFIRISYICIKYQIFSSFLFLKQKQKQACFIRIVEIILYPTNFFKKYNNFGNYLRQVFIELGPIYIKFGQILSSSPKLIGMDIAEELKLLQDRLPSVEYHKICSILEISFNKNITELFAEFEKIPVSTASVAQVHKAKTINGEEVAVKILRPNIHKTYKRDLKFLKKLIYILQVFFPKLYRLKLLEVVKILKDTMTQELNLLLEAASASELSRNMQQDKLVYIPKIYWSLSNKNVLTTEWISGKTIYDIIKFDTLDKILIAEKLAIVFFYQTFRDGFFHADLHPGNILIMSDGSIALVDFGIMSRLKNNERLIIAEVLYCFLIGNYSRIAELHLKAGYIPSHSNLELFAQSCKLAYEKLQKNSDSDLSIAQLLQDLFKITEEFGMQTQSQLILLQKNMVLIEGIGRILCPHTNMWELARPHITKWASRNLTLEAKIIRAIKDLFYNLV